MTTEKMTITKALSELKLLDKRISDDICETKFCAANKHFQRTLDGKPVNTAKKEMQSAYDKITALIVRRNAIKKALTLINATTPVTIGEQTMTVAEAIYFKTQGIENDKLLLSAMSEQYNRVVNTLNQNNGDKLSKECEQYITNTFGAKETRTDNEEIEKARQSYIESNTYDIIEGVDTKKTIETLKDKINKFEAEVDAAITVANATTEIEIEY